MDSNHFDVIIIGAGPAGGQCARELSQRGRKVLLVEKVIDFAKNNFSSAGSPNETMTVFNLPEKVAGSHWDSINFITDKVNVSWKSQKKEGVVFDFKVLREFLAEDAKEHGAKVLMDYTYISRGDMSNQYTSVIIQNNQTKENAEFFGKVIVDGTGPAQKVMYLQTEKKPRYGDSNGLEYIVKIKKYKKPISNSTLKIFVGGNYAPSGYSWIFPMQENIFKFGIGVSIESLRNKIKAPLTKFVDPLIHEYVEEGDYEIIDKHGGTVSLNKLSNQRYYQNNIVGIGDAISTIYPLAGEGVRHAMYSGRIASKYIEDFMDGKITSFENYKKAMKRYFGLKWAIGSFVLDIFGKSDESNSKNIDLGIKILGKLNIKEIIDIFFYYKFSLFFKAFFLYFWPFKSNKEISAT